MEKKKILVIDDEETIGRIVKLNLEETGDYTVRNLTAGSQAVSVAGEFKPDFIFLDLIMPDMDGTDVFNALKENDKTKNIPVVFLTAIATDREAGSGGATIGGHPFLAKPITTAKLIECIKKYGR